MLLYGKSQCLSFVDARIFNLTGLIEGFESLSILIPPNELGHFTEKEFDIAYMNYIMGNDIIFSAFFKIVHSLYIGQDVFIISDDADWSENLIESLFKLIQQRYGYNGYNIKTFEDYIYAKNNDTSTFDPGYGIYNLDIDKDRYSMVSKKIAIFNNNPSLENNFI